MDFTDKYAQWCDIMDALDVLTPDDTDIRDVLTKAAKAIEKELYEIHQINLQRGAYNG